MAHGKQLDGTGDSGMLDEEDMESARLLLAYALVKGTGMKLDDVCSVLFGRGYRITWH